MEKLSAKLADASVDRVESSTVRLSAVPTVDTVMLGVSSSKEMAEPAKSVETVAVAVSPSPSVVVAVALRRMRLAARVRELVPTAWSISAYWVRVTTPAEETSRSKMVLAEEMLPEAVAVEPTILPLARNRLTLALSLSSPESTRPPTGVAVMLRE